MLDLVLAYFLSQQIHVEYLLNVSYTDRNGLCNSLVEERDIEHIIPKIINYKYINLFKDKEVVST